MADVHTDTDTWTSQPRTSTAPTLAGARLAGQVAAALAAPALEGASLSLLAVDLTDGSILLSRDPARRLTPASVTKLYTTAFALATLGADHRLTTSVAAHGRLTSGTLHGDLVLRGGGDPMLDRDGLRRLAAAAARAGPLRRVTGRLLTDTSAFAAPAFAPGWTREDFDLPGAASPGALSAESNRACLRLWPGRGPDDPLHWSLDAGAGCVEVTLAARTGPAGSGNSIDVLRDPERNHLHASGALALDHPPIAVWRAIVDPAAWTASLFAAALRAEGVELAPDAPSLTPPHTPDGSARELARLDSPPLAELCAATNKPSDNFVAEQLLHTAAARRPPAPALSAPPGVPAVAARGYSPATGQLIAWLGEVDIIDTPDAVRLADGSGLSRYNLVSAASTVALLQFVARQPYRGAFVASQPVAGIDGSLANRLRDTAAVGRVRAKTGTLGGVRTLAGYVGPPHDGAPPRVAFALLINGLTDKADGAIAAADAVALALTEWTIAREAAD